MTPKRRPDGTITNATELSVEDVSHQRVLCPCCGDHVFNMWPEGWDEHAAHKCAGLTPGTDEQRKLEFKSRFKYLFR